MTGKGDSEPTFEARAHEQYQPLLAVELTAPGHYAKAEILLDAAEQEDDPAASDRLVAAAAVHATLAAAGAAALTTSQGTLPVKDRNAWHEVAGVTPASAR